MRLASIIATTFMAVALAEDGQSHYDNQEKERFIYGKPGDADFGVPRTADDIIRLEKMWNIDMDLQKSRGAIQGYH